MRKKQKRLIKDKARIIIDFINTIGGYATANEISKETGLAYLTVQKYLNQLEKDDIIVEVNKAKSKQKKYNLNYDKILKKEK